MIDRRSLLGLAAAVPLAGKLPRLDLPDIRVDALRFDDDYDAEILSISPDGSILVGMVDREKLCFYDTVTRDLISITVPVGDITFIDTSSVKWSPDGTKLAFGLDAFLSSRDSDVFVVDVTDGAIRNLTGEGDREEAQSLLGASDVHVDMYPQWLDDETLVFARHTWIESEDITTSLVSMKLEDTEATIWAELDSPDIRFVMKQMVLLNDGRVVFAADSADNLIRLFTVAAGEAPQQIDTGEMGFFHMVDANETHVLIMHPETSISWRVAIDGSESPQNVTDLFEFDKDEVLASLPAFGPAPGSMVIAKADKNRTVMVYENERVRDIAYLRGPESMITQILWVPDHVLVAGRGSSWVIPHES